MASAVCSEWYLIPFIVLNSKHTSDLTLYGSLWQSPQRNTSQLRSSADLPPDGSAGPWGLHFFVLLFLNSKGRCTAELHTYICITWVNKTHVRSVGCCDTYGLFQSKKQVTGRVCAGGTTLGLMIQTGCCSLLFHHLSGQMIQISVTSFYIKLHVLILDMPRCY